MKRTDYTPETIHKKARIRFVRKILLILVMETAGMLFMVLYGAAYFGRISEQNAVVMYAVLAAAPFLVSGIFVDLIDRGWTGKIQRIYTSVITKWSPDEAEGSAAAAAGVGRNNRYSVSVRVRLQDGHCAEKNLGILLDSDLDRMKEGDTITHFRGTHLCRIESDHRPGVDHYIGRL